MNHPDSHPNPNSNPNPRDLTPNLGMPARVNCLVLSIEGRKLLIPSTVVAEVYSNLEAPVGGDGHFCYGWINWRELRIPLVSLEVFLGAEPPALERLNRVAILNAVDAAAPLQFFAVRLDSIPQTVPVTALTPLVASDEDDVILEMELGRLRVALPRLDGVEARVAALTPA